MKTAVTMPGASAQLFKSENNIKIAYKGCDLLFKTMSERKISITVNEKPLGVSPALTCGALRDRMKPGADVLIRNGFPCGADAVLRDGDRVVLIRRGEVPSTDELEVLMTARHTPAIHAKLKQGVVGIAGLGGLGSAVAVALARAGVGTLILVDFDVVEPSNLNRQQYEIGHIGMPKSEAMADVLNRINPYTTLYTHAVKLDRENISSIFKEAMVLIECFDGPDQKAMLVESAREDLPDTYIIVASGMAGFGDSNRIQTIRAGKKIFITGDQVTAAEPGRGLMAPRVGIAACHQANLAVSLLVDSEGVVL
jgi:sulfur carrier protein ThiS adenylyltransferase